MNTCAHTKAHIHTHTNTHTHTGTCMHLSFPVHVDVFDCLHFLDVPSQSCRTKAAWVTAQDFVRRKTKGGKRQGGRSGEETDRSRKRRKKKKKKKRKMELRIQ